CPISSPATTPCPRWRRSPAACNPAGSVSGPVSDLSRVALGPSALPGYRGPVFAWVLAWCRREQGADMLRPFPGFATYTTRHCVTGSLKHIYEYHGYPVSEDLLLGLGCGLGFVYFHIKGSDPFYGGRANVARPGQEGLEKTAGRRTGVAVTSHSTSSA